MSLYNIDDYGRMIADRVRADAYARALCHAVKPTSVVLDIGTGTGIWSLLACQFGARKVYAIEPDEVIQVAREIAFANGYADRIGFIQNLSTQVKLPERVDVMISDMRSILPLFQHHIPSIIDARERFLSKKGTLIPLRDLLWAAVVEAPDLIKDLNPAYGLNMDAAQRFATNISRKARVKPDQLLVEPRCWATLDYQTIESPDISAKITWTVLQEGIGHGLITWFDAVLAEGIGFSNAPGAPDPPELNYGNLFFPWSKPVHLAMGDTVSITMNANLVSDDYVWRWDTCVLNQGHSGEIKANFKQSSFYGSPLSPTLLSKRAHTHKPALNEDGLIDKFILTLMDGKTSLSDIAYRVLAQFPNKFTKWEDTLTRVGELSAKYSQ